MTSRSALARALGAFGTIATLDGAGVEVEEYGPALDRAEREFDHVLLVEGAEPTWTEFCRRQCDRLLVVVSNELPGPEWDGGTEERELLFVGSSEETIERWLDAVPARTHHVVSTGSEFTAGIERVARRLTGHSMGLVFSGGGARGLAHIGALSALTDAGFAFDRIGGCSMGSFIAAMAAVGHDAEEIQATCARELVRRSPFNDYTLPRVSLIRARKAGAMLERVFGSALMETLERPLFTVSADLLSSLVVVHRRGSIIEAVGASMNLPGLVPPLRRAGRLLVDGGVLNNLPVDHMAEMREGPIVAVDVVRRIDGAERPRSRRCRRSRRRSPGPRCSAPSSGRSAIAPLRSCSSLRKCRESRFESGRRSMPQSTRAAGRPNEHSRPAARRRCVPR